MAKTFELPDPGEGIHEAEVVEVHVASGDRVEESDILLDVETDKAVVEVPAPFTGTVTEVLVEEGDDVRVGDVVLEYEEGEGEGDEVPSQEEESPADGGESAGKEETAGEEASTEEEESAEDDRTTDPEQSGERPVPAAPSTRRLARELDVDLHAVEATGPEGRVTDEDVRRLADEAEAEVGGEEAVQEEVEGPGGETPEAEEEAAPAAHEARAEKAEGTAAAEEAEEERTEGEREDAALSGLGPPPSYEDPEEWGSVEREPLRSVRRTTARRMADAWRRIPHVTHVDHADITELEAFRQEHDAAVEDADLTLTVFLLKAVVAVLKEFPRFNARLDEEAEEIAYLQYYDLGVATDTERGLLVPVVRDVDAKSLQELAREVGELTEAARERGITRDQMRGGTFTLTNPGPLGGDVITPIINPPQVGILGVGQASRRPAVVGEGDDERVAIRSILPLCLAFDHRVNDGADAARFARRLAEILEDPDAFVRHL